MNEFEEEYEFMKRIHGVNDFDIFERKRFNINPMGKDEAAGGGEIFFRQRESSSRSEIETSGRENKNENAESESQKIMEMMQKMQKKENREENTGDDVTEETKNIRKRMMESVLFDCFGRNEAHENYWNEYQKGIRENSLLTEQAPLEKPPLNFLDEEKVEKVKTEDHVRHSDLVKDKFWKFRKGELNLVREGLLKPETDSEADLNTQHIYRMEHLKKKCEEGMNRFETGLQRIRNCVNELATCDEAVYYIFANNINLYEYINHSIDLDKYYVQIEELPKYLMHDTEGEKEYYIYLSEDAFFKARKHVQNIKDSFLKRGGENERGIGTTATGGGENGYGMRGEYEQEEERRHDENRAETKRMEITARKNIELEEFMEKKQRLIRDILNKKKGGVFSGNSSAPQVSGIANTGMLSNYFGNSWLSVKCIIQLTWQVLSTLFHYDYLEYPSLKRYATYDCFNSNVKKYMRHFGKRDEEIVVDKQFVLNNRYLTPFFIHNTMDINYNVNDNGIVVLSGILPFVMNFEADYRLKQTREKNSLIEKELNGGIESSRRHPIVRFIYNLKSFFVNSVFEKFRREGAEPLNVKKSDSDDCAEFLKKFESSINDEGEFIQDIMFPGKVQMIFFNFITKQSDTNTFDPTVHLEHHMDSIKTYKIILGFDKKEHVQYSNILVSNVLKSIKKKHPNMTIDDNNPRQPIEYMYHNRCNFFFKNDDPYWKGFEEEASWWEGENSDFVREEAWGGLMNSPVDHHSETTVNDANELSSFYNVDKEMLNGNVGRELGKGKGTKKYITLSEVMDYLCYAPDHLLKPADNVCEYVTCVSFDNSAESCNLINNFAIGYNTGKVEYIYGKMDFENMNHCDLLVDYYMNKNKKYTYELNKRFYLDGGIVKIAFATNGFYCLILTYNTLYMCSFFYESLCDIGFKRYSKSSVVNILWLNNNCYAIFCNKGSVHLYERTSKCDTINGFAMTKSFFVNQPIYWNSVCSYHAYNNCILLCTGEIEKKKKVDKEGIFSRGFFGRMWKLSKETRTRKRSKIKNSAKHLNANNIQNISKKEREWSFEEELRKEMERERRERNKIEDKNREKGKIAENETTTAFFKQEDSTDPMESARTFLNERKYQKLKKNRKQKTENCVKKMRKNYFYKFEGNFLMIDLAGESDKKFVKHFYENSFFHMDKETNKTKSNLDAGNSNADIENLTLDRVGDINLLMKHVKLLEKYLLCDKNGDEEYDLFLERNLPEGLKEFNAYISGLKGMNEYLNDRYRKELGLLKENKVKVKGREHGAEYDLSYFREKKNFSMYTIFRNYVKEVRNYLYNVRNENILNILLPRFYSTEMEMNYNNFLNVRYFCIESGSGGGGGGGRESGNHLIALDARTDYVYIYEIKKNVYIEDELLEKSDMSEARREKLAKLFDPYAAKVKNLKPHWKIFEDFLYINTKSNLRYIKFDLLYVIRNEKKLYFPLHVHVIEPKMQCAEYYLLIKWGTINSTYVSSAYNSLSKISKKSPFWSEETDTVLKALEEHKDVYVMHQKNASGATKESSQQQFTDWFKLSKRDNMFKVDTLAKKKNLEAQENDKIREEIDDLVESYKTKEEPFLGKIKKGSYEPLDVCNKSNEEKGNYSKYKISNLLGSPKPFVRGEPTMDNARRDLSQWKHELHRGHRNTGNLMKASPESKYADLLLPPRNCYEKMFGSPNVQMSFDDKLKRYIMSELKGNYDRSKDWDYYRWDHFDRRGVGSGTRSVSGLEKDIERNRDRGRGYFSGMMNGQERARSEYPMRMGNTDSYFGKGQTGTDWSIPDEREYMFYNTDTEGNFRTSTPSQKKSRFSSLMNALRKLKPTDAGKNKGMSDRTAVEDWYMPNAIQGTRMRPNSYNRESSVTQQQISSPFNYGKQNPPMTSDWLPKENDMHSLPEIYSQLGFRMGESPIYKNKGSTSVTGNTSAATDTLYGTNLTANKYETVRNRRLAENISDIQRNYGNF